jgi:hypothetical protein
MFGRIHDLTKYRKKKDASRGKIGNNESADQGQLQLSLFKAEGDLGRHKYPLKAHLVVRTLTLPMALLASMFSMMAS